MRVWWRLFVVVAACMSLSPAARVATPRASTGRLPMRVLWAWERPTDLRQLSPDIGVAMLAQTIRLGASGVVVRPRRQPLHVDPRTPLVAVTRIETEPPAADRIEAVDLSEVAARIAATAGLPQVVRVQIDFDATASERALYRRILVAVRSSLPDDLPLSITALASWCASDRWFDGLPVDEAVPMLFQLGTVDEAYAQIAASRRNAAPACRGALGVSLDEPLDVRADGRRVYVFNPDAWTPTSTARAQEIGR
jgi:hypothetical protein